MRRIGRAGAMLLAIVLPAIVIGPWSPASADASAARVEVVDAEDSSFAEEAASRVAALDLRQQAASVVMGHVPTTDPVVLAASMSGGLGGFLLMGANIPGTEGELRPITAALTADPGFPPLIAVDEEGGDVTRLPWDLLPGADTLKGTEPAAAEEAFAARGSLLARAGIGVNFGIVADVASGPGSFIFSRAFGTTPAAAAERVDAAVRGEAPFALSTLKHFPGHGAAEGDSHSMIPRTPMTLDEWRSSVAPPFIAGIEAGAPLVMLGHLAYTAVDPLPASLSPAWHTILRDELGFDGVVVTDDLGMLVSSGVPAYADPVADAVASLAAGSDLVLMVVGSDTGTASRIAEGIAVAVESGALPAGRLAEAATRVAELRLRMAASPPGWQPCPECRPAA
ncbi:beta-N-acetylhexosaminidase [Microbacterium resistens]|uniref:Beta-N-acetylhexosaminidase n=1 Tax=Microbacterium resistens TaxID=156977 RepID=A0ABU1SGS7_9MICO|nr:glycoside hydrolase family 3 N-terminal domain-containing protein [Microbacterium resistens]MDR6868813.1 beta-N-acetylhexosaminidase [Microbacterium resistens]